MKRPNLTINRVFIVLMTVALLEVVLTRTVLHPYIAVGSMVGFFLGWTIRSIFIDPETKKRNKK